MNIGKICITLLGLVMLAFPLKSGQNALTDYLLAYYPFEGNVNDYSGNSFHGIVYGNPSFVTDRVNYDESALHLDGVDDYVVFPIGKHPTMAISVWLNPDMYADSAFIFDYGQSTFYSEIDAFTSATNPAYMMNNGCAAVKFRSSSYLWFTEWHHIYVDSGNGMQGPRLFFDGYLNKSVANAVGLKALNELLYLGKPADSNAQKTTYFSGELDDLRIYSRVLTSLEVYQEYLKNPIGLEEHASKKTKIRFSKDSKTIYLPGHELFVSYVEIFSLHGQLLYREKFSPSVDISSFKKAPLIIRLLDFDGNVLLCEKLFVP